MKRGRGFKFLCGAAIFLFVAAVSARAAEESGSATEHANEIFKWIKFVIVAGLIGWVFLKRTPPFFRTNAENISSAITKAPAAKAQRDGQLLEAEEKPAPMQQEVAPRPATAH